MERIWNHPREAWDRGVGSAIEFTAKPNAADLGRTWSMFDKSSFEELKWIHMTRLTLVRNIIPYDMWRVRCIYDCKSLYSYR